MEPSVSVVPPQHRVFCTAAPRPQPLAAELDAQKSRRPLYLGTRVKARVDVDGPALHVRAAGRAEARYPLYRVSRVIASARVDWSARALHACLETGIPIVILGDDGAPLGSFHPARVRSSPLSEDLEELLDRPDWPEIYDGWLRAARMRVLGERRRAREAAGESLAAGEFKELVRRYVYGCADALLFEEATGLWRAALYALAAQAVRRAGLQPVYWGAGGIALNLLDDLARLLALRLRLEVSGGMEHGLSGEAVALRVFHAQSERLEEQCDRFFALLARRVKQVLAEWR
ncbi:MAG: CRISPR-associated endonuclease Cas1 [Betaproteobacteria bacterium]|nr:CRISPR-associated endonuclease Cas1 [Betaproteobacteria bacterium]